MAGWEEDSLIINHECLSCQGGISWIPAVRDGKSVIESQCANCGHCQTIELGDSTEPDSTHEFADPFHEIDQSWRWYHYCDDRRDALRKLNPNVVRNQHRCLSCEQMTWELSMNEPIRDGQLNWIPSCKDECYMMMERQPIDERNTCMRWRKAEKHGDNHGDWINPEYEAFSIERDAKLLDWYLHSDERAERIAREEEERNRRYLERQARIEEKRRQRREQA